MARNLIKSMSIDVCADCGQIEAPWVSVNRGVLLCDGCCSVHLSLGRHVSQIKHLKKGAWCPQQLKMAHQLVTSGANNIWEYTLVDPSQNRSTRKKPASKDPIHPTKADYIRAKYQLLTFINKPKESDTLDFEDYSKQLHSSVRTNNLETSLRLLASGADPNYIHPDKGTSVLHVASYSNQPLQVELLLVYGTDPSFLDNTGKTPLDLARNNGFVELADRLVECQYELTDGLAYYLCKRKPDHKGGVHFINLEVSDGLDLSETAKGAKKKLQALPNHLFEELALDVYGEADRRENVEIWLSSQSTSTHVVSERQVVPFLPSNPEFSATRNQGRQKLAKFNKREFTTLIIDILNDAKRRYCCLASILPSPAADKNEKQQLVTNNNNNENTYNDKTNNSTHKLTTEQIYDQVYTESDYALIGEGLVAQIDALSTSSVSISTTTTAYNPSHLANDKINNQSSSSSSKSNSSDEAAVLKKSLLESQQHNQHLLIELERCRLRCQQLTEDVTVLKTTIDKLKHENRVYKAFASTFDPTNPNPCPLPGIDTPSHLRWTVMERPEAQRQLTFKDICADDDFPSPPQDLLMTSRSADFDPKEQPSHISQQHWQSADAATSSTTTASRDHPFSTPGSTGSTMICGGGGGRGVGEGMAGRMGDWVGGRGIDERDSGGRVGEVLSGRIGIGEVGGRVMPSQEEVVRKTERITKALQELFQMAQDNKIEVYSKCADRIQTAVTEMMRLFPSVVNSPGQLEALKSLDEGSEKIRVLCEGVGDEGEMKTHTQKIIHTAYDIAKAAKHLVMSYE